MSRPIPTNAVASMTDILSKIRLKMVALPMEANATVTVSPPFCASIAHTAMVSAVDTLAAPMHSHFAQGCGATTMMRATTNGITMAPRARREIVPIMSITPFYNPRTQNTKPNSASATTAQVWRPTNL